jgi:hypothetical protein
MKLNEIIQKPITVAGPLELFYDDIKHGLMTKTYGKVKGDFIGTGSDLTFQLTSLKNGPTWVQGVYCCRNNLLTSLEFCASYVGEGFDCANNEITSLEYAPEKIGRSFFCGQNPISSLSGIGRKYLKEIPGGILNTYGCPIVSNVLGIFLIKGLTQFRMVSEIGSSKLDQRYKVHKLLRRLIEEETDILDAQEELITNGFKEYAKL